MFFGKLPGKIIGFTVIAVALIVLGYFFNNVYSCGFFTGVITTITWYSIFKEGDDSEAKR